MNEKLRQNLLAQQIGQVKAKTLKQYHAHLLCKSLIQMLKAGK